MNVIVPEAHSHRFRSQLATIVSSAELLQLYAAHLSGNEREELLGEIRAAAQRMRDMLDAAAEAGEAGHG